MPCIYTNISKCLEGLNKIIYSYTKRAAKERSCTFILFALGRGSRRLIVLEEIYPLKKKLEQRWVRGWDCGWTPYGLCFSPYWRQDIHDNFIIPFKDLKFSVYVDEIVIPRFGLGSVVLTEFSQKKNYLWEARVYRYRAGWNSKYGRMLAYQLFVTTDFVDLKVQLKESFHPNSVRKKGNTR